MSLEDILKPNLDPRFRFYMVVSIGKGWEPLVIDLHHKLREIDPDYQIVQIKEKFGGLRYYTRQTLGVFDEFRDLINEAEELSFKTCEECGGTDEVETDTLGPGYFWIFTLCDTCRAERLAQRQKRDAELAAKYGD